MGRISSSNHRYIHFNKNAGTNCKAWGYKRYFNKRDKVWINKHFYTKTEALWFKFIMNLRINAGHTFVKVKRNTWYE